MNWGSTVMNKKLYPVVVIHAVFLVCAIIAWVLDWFRDVAIAFIALTAGFLLAFAISRVKPSRQWVIASRLEDLTKLKEQGLISVEEHNTRVLEILNQT
jgi:hypothetical protein